MFADIWRENKKMKFWFSGADVALNENPTRLAVIEHPFQARFESSTASQYDNSGDLSPGTQTSVRVALGGRDG